MSNDAFREPDTTDRRVTVFLLIVSLGEKIGYPRGQELENAIKVYVVP